LLRRHRGRILMGKKSRSTKKTYKRAESPFEPEVLTTLLPSICRPQSRPFLGSSPHGIAPGGRPGENIRDDHAPTVPVVLNLSFIQGDAARVFLVGGADRRLLANGFSGGPETLFRNLFPSGSMERVRTNPLLKKTRDPVRGLFKNIWNQAVKF